jgi:hypothetical protein
MNDLHSFCALKSLRAARNLQGSTRLGGRQVCVDPETFGGEHVDLHGHGLRWPDISVRQTVRAELVQLKARDRQTGDDRCDCALLGPHICDHVAVLADLRRNPAVFERVQQDHLTAHQRPGDR